MGSRTGLLQRPREDITATSSPGRWTPGSLRASSPARGDSLHRQAHPTSQLLSPPRPPCRWRYKAAGDAGPPILLAWRQACKSAAERSSPPPRARLPAKALHLQAGGPLRGAWPAAVRRMMAHAERDRDPAVPEDRFQWNGPPRELPKAARGQAVQPPRLDPAYVQGLGDVEIRELSRYQEVAP